MSETGTILLTVFLKHQKDKNLGEINRTRLRKYSEAAKAYKIALTRDPNDTDCHVILAELYELSGEKEKAVEEQWAKGRNIPDGLSQLIREKTPGTKRRGSSVTDWLLVGRS